MNAYRLPSWFTLSAHALPWLMLAVCIVISLVDPAYFNDRVLAKDSPDGAGWVENLTALALVPGILAGLYASIRQRRRFPQPLLAGWVLLWSLACIYFAGEEVSWGQWFFHWSTPESMAELNDQHETNLHNISSWLDQKPRALVEIWIFVTGLLMPAALLFKGRRRDPTNWQYWAHPVNACWSAAAVFTLVRIAHWIDTPLTRQIGDSELRELCIALFLALFLLSFPLRLRSSA